MSTLTASQKLAAYVNKLTFDRIPTPVVQNCKAVILDTLGVALAGSQTEHGRIAAAFAQEYAEKRQSTIIGCRSRTSCLNAAFANSVMAHGIDFDDDYEPGALHAGCAVIPASLAIAEYHGSTGKELISAVTAGYDVACRVAAAIYPMLAKRVGFHITGLANCFGVAAAAGRLLNLSQEEIADAFGIAGDEASGLRQYHYDGTMLKHFHAGKAAQNGIFAALLAQKGYTGYPRILEGEWGFCEVISQGNYDPETLTRNLGEDFLLTKTSLKPWPSCRHTHTAIEAVLFLRHKYRLTPESIQKVTLRVFRRAFEDSNKPSPDTVVEALLSQQFAVSTALARGHVSTSDFWLPGSLKDKTITDLIKKVEVIEDTDLTRVAEIKRNKPSEVRITTKDGRTLIRRVEYPLGSPENPMSETFLTEKFCDLAQSVVSQEKIQKLLNAVHHLESIENVAGLARLLS